MMFSVEDLKIESFEELLLFLPIAPFVGLVAPFLLAAYGLGFVMDITGWLETD
jgi:hypothetical protein